MSYFRSYFSKNNTIIKDSLLNTAKNPNTEIFYGNGFSKFLFRLDLDELKTRVTNGDLVLDNFTKHNLYLTNTIFGDESFLGQTNGKNRERATSFDLILFSINEYWDEGVGHDYEKTYDFTTGNETIDDRPSNWFNRTNTDAWSEEGVYSSSPSNIITTLHFDNGNEDFVADITDYINDILTGLTINYGLGIAFDVPYMNISNDIEQSVAFFTMYTQTFFEPYLETVFDDVIEDNRNDFAAEIQRNLYLYVTKGNNFYDLDELPVVDILSSTNTVITGLNDIVTTKVRKGVYKVTFGMTGTICDNRKFYYDLWKNLFIEGLEITPVKQRFIPKPYSSLLTIGENVTDLERYSIQFFGVRLNEKIKRGEKKKIVITFRSINERNSIVLDDVYYRIYVKEGHTQVNVFDWTKVDKTNENSFILDTSYLIPREYYMEIKAKTHNEEIFYRDDIKFEIISEKVKKNG